MHGQHDIELYLQDEDDWLRDAVKRSEHSELLAGTASELNSSLLSGALQPLLRPPSRP